MISESKTQYIKRKLEKDIHDYADYRSKHGWGLKTWTDEDYTKYGILFGKIQLLWQMEILDAEEYRRLYDLLTKRMLCCSLNQI